MTRNEALAQAKVAHKARTAAMIDGLFGRAPAFTEAEQLSKFGYRHGWYRVGEYNFSHDEVSGESYDHAQGGWAYL